MKSYYLLVLAMAIVTYLPRVIPLIFLQQLRIPPGLQNFLNNIPYAALGALILPGIISSTGNPLYSLVGAITAIVLALVRLNLLIVVLGSIFSVLLWQLWF